MKKLLYLLLIIFSFSFSKAQTILLSDDFDSGNVPGTGWTIDTHQTNWEFSNTTYAGGESQGELGLKGYPDFWSTTRYISPTVDLSSSPTISVNFIHTLFFSTSIPGNGVIGVATRSGNGAWHSVWEVDITATIETDAINIPINNSDANATDFQFCFYFNGTSYIMDWYIDDIALSSVSAHDISVMEILGQSVYEPNTSYQAQAIFKNTGLNTETYDVVCTIYDESNNQLFTDTQTITNQNPNDTETVTFTSYTISNSNALYKVVVTSNLNNDQNTGNNSLSKNIYTYTTERDQVLLEIGTGTWCTYCQGAALAADDLIANGKDVAIIEYHVNDNFATSNGLARTDYYGILSFPTAFFNGTVNSPQGGLTSVYQTYLPFYEQQKTVKTGVTIDVSETHTGNNYTVNVDLNKVGPIADDNLVLFMVLTESHINHNWQNQHELNFVQRLILPDANGQIVDLVNNTNLNTAFNFQIDNTWTNDLEVIVFIQNKETKEVLNSSKLALTNTSGIETELANDSLTVYPNPATDFIKIKSPDDDTIQNIKILDLTGKVVKQVKKLDINRPISISDIQSGIYLLVITNTKNKSSYHKIVLK